MFRKFKGFFKNDESQKLSKNEVSTNFISIQKKYCGDNFCDVDSETSMKADDFVEYKKKLIDLKQTTKGGKKEKQKDIIKKLVKIKKVELLMYL